MYTLTLTPDTETRTRTVTKTGTRTVTDPVTGEETEEEYEYEEEEEYEVSILRVVLTVKPLETIVAGKMDAEQTEIYAMYAETGGLLQQFASPLDLYWYNYISSYYGYRKNPNTGNEELHRGVDIAVPTGTTVYAAHDGTVTTAAYDSYYGIMWSSKRRLHHKICPHGQPECQCRSEHNQRDGNRNYGKHRKQYRKPFAYRVLI